MNLSNAVAKQMINPGLAHIFDIGKRITGTIVARVLDRPKPGRSFGRPITDWFRYPNGATTLGLNYMLDAAFRGGTQYSSWYIGLIDETGYSAVAASDTSASHPGWTELTTYTSTPRLAWAPGAAASGSVTISSAVTFTTNADSQIRGIFIANSSTKNSTTDLIWATAVEAAARTILSGQQYQCYYTVTITP